MLFYLLLYPIYHLNPMVKTISDPLLIGATARTKVLERQVKQVGRQLKTLRKKVDKALKDLDIK